MARSIERIEQDITALEDAIAQLREEFYKTYSQYLNLLGQAVRRQLILATYQVCTQGYPEAFVSLSFNHRQKLQQSILQLGKKTQQQLLTYLESSKDLVETESSDTQSRSPTSSEQSEDIAAQQLLKTLDTKETSALAKTQPTPSEQLAKWQEQLEEAIARTLQNLSLDTNRLLQQAGILPSKLPTAVLEAAAKADSSTESVTVGSPNLLNLIMETESDDDSEDSTLTRIIAINLRLSEIEFADPALSAGRNQLRNLAAKGNTLHREYHKHTRERAVAQAESAWRASWFED